ncbi:MAG: D-alanyl-D-alanine carboxypeptidase/D-alanyl-D-alanine-endopeptidase [Acidimicrobiales bacterium]
MIRRLIVPVLLIGVIVAAMVQANRTDDESAPVAAPEAGPPSAGVGTPLLSVRRTPEWLRRPLSDSLFTSEVAKAAVTPVTPALTCLTVHRDGETIIDRGGSALFVPASTQKILTAAAILQLAEAGDTFVTSVVIRLDSTIDEEGVLDGDVWLIGGGDPVLSTPDYIGRFDEPRAFTDFTDLVDEVAAELTRLGVTTIGGRIVADESKYSAAERDYTDQIGPDEETPIWKQSFVDENQVGPLSALLVNDGYTAWPDDPALRRENTRASDPAEAAADLLGEMLVERGIDVTGGGVNGGAEVPAPLLAERTSLGEIESPPLSDIIARMLQHSDNTTAEMLFKEIGQRSGTVGGEQRGLAVFAVSGALSDAGYPAVRSTGIADGSGLSSFNETRCRLLVQILDEAGPDSTLVRSMAVVGESGTLRVCMDGDPTVDNGDVFGKTGTLNDVTALAGLTVADNGDILTFAVIANGVGVGTDLGSCNQIQTTIIDAVAGHPYGPSIDDLSPLPASVG